MPQHAYAQGGHDAARPTFVWRFDTPWLRDAALHENPGLLVAVPAGHVQHRVRRAERHGWSRYVAPGIVALLYDPLPRDAPFPSVPRLRLPPPLAARVMSGVAALGRRYGP